MIAQTSEDIRYRRGLDQLARVNGGGGADRPFAALDAVCPDLGRYTVEFVFGEILSRPGLTLRVREIVTVAALAALGTARPQLAYHVGGALNVGWRAGEIVSVIGLVQPHAGPAAAQALHVAHEVFAARGDAAPAQPPDLEPALAALATIALLTALATAPQQLRAELRAARSAGCSRDEIAEVLLQMAIYAGFPADINGLAAFADQLAQS